jgi:hypothetical protein
MISMSYGFEACSCPANVQKLNGRPTNEDEAELPVSMLSKPSNRFRVIRMERAF